jgi:3-dehydroquinate dehydratase-1
MIYIGTVPLDETPRVVLALRDGVPRDAIEAALAQGVDLVELRIDEFQDTRPQAVEAECERLRGIPLLATIRSAVEGGAWKQNDHVRLDLFRAVLPMVDAIDIELSSRSMRELLIADAKEAGKTVLGSFHDFEDTPQDALLNRLADDARRVGVDLLKVAAHCNDVLSLRRLARFTLDHAQRGCVVIAMGPIGASSRIFFPALGSRLTYTFLGEPTAPGQLNCDDTLAYLNAFYPGRSALR